MSLSASLHYFLRGAVVAREGSGVGQTLGVHRAWRRGGTRGGERTGACGTGLECQHRE